jgi:ribosomal protein L37AE/L43A
MKKKVVKLFIVLFILLTCFISNHVTHVNAANKAYGYRSESSSSKYKRIFGSAKKKSYKSSSQAKKNMKTIKIKVWNISNNKKVTKTKSITVHKNIASTVQKIFDEIYNGSEKFPIYSVGGYSWRGNSSKSEHNLGLAIDINPNENYMINGKKILAGKFWKPGKNPYSIPKNGDVVKAFEKYGFKWGHWGNKHDYMHFSYFGN